MKRNLYYACNEGDHVRVTIGHVLPGQRAGISYANYNLPKTPGGGDVLNLFPALATDAAGNVYTAWIDGTNFNLYYAFSIDEGKSWSAPVKVNSGSAATNEFDWAQAGKAGKLALAWYATDVKQLSDSMPSMLDPTQADAATNYQWHGYAALVDNANTAKPVVRQTRFTAKPMHYGNICHSGLGCTTDLTADRTMADFLGFTLARDGSLRIVFNDGTNEVDGAGPYATRQIAGTTATGVRLNGSAAKNPVTDVSADAQFPHYAPGGAGPNLPQLDLTRLKLSNPTSSTLRVQMTVTDASQLVGPATKPIPVWLTRFQALSPPPGGTANVYRIFYVYMEKRAGVLPSFYAGTASCQGTTPSNCKIFQYRGEKPVDGKIEGNTITIDVGLNGDFGSPVLGKTLYSVTAFTFRAYRQLRRPVRGRRRDRAVRLRDRQHQEVAKVPALNGEGGPGPPSPFVASSRACAPRSSSTRLRAASPSGGSTKSRAGSAPWRRCSPSGAGMRPSSRAKRGVTRSSSSAAMVSSTRC